MIQPFSRNPPTNFAHICLHAQFLALVIAVYLRSSPAPAVVFEDDFVEALSTPTVPILPQYYAPVGAAPAVAPVLGPSSSIGGDAWRTRMVEKVQPKLWACFSHFCGSLMNF